MQAGFLEILEKNTFHTIFLVPPVGVQSPYAKGLENPDVHRIIK